MRKHAALLVISLTIAGCATTSQRPSRDGWESSTPSVTETRDFHIGASSVSTVLTFNVAGWEGDEFTGLGIYGGMAFNDNFGLRGHVGFQSDDYYNADVLAFEVTLQAGTGLATEGFKAYGSLGVYSETWESAYFEESFSGGLLGGGLGYNWSPIALDFWVHFRSTSDYQEAYFGTNSWGEVSAVSGGIGLSGRF